MIYGLDAAYPPRDAGEASYYLTNGWQFFCGYIGGRALNVWTPESWNIVWDAGFRFLPIWVAPSGNDASEQQGVDEGNAALVTMQSLGMSGIVALDVEDGATPSEYLAGFAAALHAGSCSLALYGTAATVDALAVPSLVDRVWLAMWPSSPQTMHAAPIAPDLWQFASGPQCDYNVANDEFPWAQHS